MVIQNNVGGWLYILELGIKLGPEQIVDLDFCCSREQQEGSKELRRAISRRFIKVISAQKAPHNNFYTTGSIIGPVLFKPSEAHSLRRAIFLKTNVPINPPYNFFMMQDLPSKLAIVEKATDIKLLGTVISKELDGKLVQAAHGKLQELVG